MTIARVKELLGGENALGREVRTRMDQMDIDRKGVSKESLLSPAKFMGLPVSRMTRLLPVTESTVQRCTPKKHFDRFVSECILQAVKGRGIGRSVPRRRRRGCRFASAAP